eukprot:2692130-Pyramimonas_sp.AAC.1
MMDSGFFLKCSSRRSAAHIRLTRAQEFQGRIRLKPKKLCSGTIPKSQDAAVTLKGGVEVQ